MFEILYVVFSIIFIWTIPYVVIRGMDFLSAKRYIPPDPRRVIRGELHDLQDADCKYWYGDQKWFDLKVKCPTCFRMSADQIAQLEKEVLEASPKEWVKDTETEFDNSIQKKTEEDSDSNRKVPTLRELTHSWIPKCTCSSCTRGSSGKITADRIYLP